jgi:predicted small integral membrane protein
MSTLHDHAPADPDAPPSATRTSRAVRALASPPVLSVSLVALNALYISLVAFGNITDFDSNRAFVHHVLAMDTTNFGAPAGTGLDHRVMWRAITGPGLQDLAYIGVIVWETAAALVLGCAVGSWVRGRRRGYGDARALSTIGLLMIIALFAGGFIAVGGEWFAMYRSTDWNGLEPAFRNSVLALATILVIRQPTDSSSTS